MSQIITVGVGGKVRSAAAERRARGAERRARAEARRKERAERKVKRAAWREVRAAQFVYFYVCEGVGFIRINKQEARLLIDKLGSRLIVRTTPNSVAFELCPF